MRREKGQRNHLAGLAAEEVVLRHYTERGAALLAQRWRSPAGEIDLIFRQGAVVLFVEVKAGPDALAAAGHLSPAQLQRLQAAAALYLDALPDGARAEARLDLALVTGPGAVEVIANIGQE